MSRKRRRRKVGKHISLSATDADWETVRSNANRRGLSIARYLVELVERDASEEDAGLRHECPALALAAEEQREQLEAVLDVGALLLLGPGADEGHRLGDGARRGPLAPQQPVEAMPHVARHRDLGVVGADVDMAGHPGDRMLLQVVADSR